MSTKTSNHRWTDPRARDAATAATTANIATAAQGTLFDMPIAVDPGTVVLNPDGNSVKGYTCIYAPKGQAGEYAALACNPYRGCGHCCRYNQVGRFRSCYVTRFTGQPVPEFNAGAVLVPNFLADLRKEAAKYKAAGITAQVLLTFTSDPYHPGNTTPTREVLEILIEHGLGFCTLTKGGTRALRDLDLFRPDRDAYAATLTSLDDRFSRQWEPKAPLPGDRIAALKTFHAKGIPTWVSLEPVLDVEATLAVIAATHEFVNFYKVGRLNYDDLTRTIDWRDLTLRAVALLNRLGAAHYFKKDLQPYLPPGYPNRVPTSPAMTTTYARARAGFDDAHVDELRTAIMTAIATTSKVSDAEVIAIRTAELTTALLDVLTMALYLPPESVRSPTAIRKLVDVFGKRLRRRIAAAERDRELQDFLLHRCFRGGEREGNA